MLTGMTQAIAKTLGCPVCPRQETKVPLYGYKSREKSASGTSIKDRGHCQARTS